MTWWTEIYNLWKEEFILNYNGFIQESNISVMLSIKKMRVLNNKKKTWQIMKKIYRSYMTLLKDLVTWYLEIIQEIYRPLLYKIKLSKITHLEIIIIILNLHMISNLLLMVHLLKCPLLNIHTFKKMFSLILECVF